MSKSETMRGSEIKRSRRSSIRKPSVNGSAPSGKQPQASGAQGIPAAAPAIAKPIPGPKLALGGLCLAIGIWAYWPTIVDLVATWNREPDYSHGYLVLPAAAAFLWIRRRTFPGLGASSPELGMVLLGISLAMRYVAGRYFIAALDGWSLMPWVAGLVAVMGGRPLLAWCLPSIGFMFFMVPLPFRLENEFSSPLQRIATKLSTATLQLLGQPAFSEGNVILLGEERLEVAQACSGLRLFVSTLALAYAYLVMIERPWLDKLVLVLAVGPIAIIANSARIVTTGMLYQLAGGDWIRKAVHDFAGWGMILVAATLFWLLLWYLSQLIRDEPETDVAMLVQQSKP